MESQIETNTDVFNNIFNYCNLPLIIYKQETHSLICNKISLNYFGFQEDENSLFEAKKIITNIEDLINKINENKNNLNDNFDIPLNFIYKSNQQVSINTRVFINTGFDNSILLIPDINIELFSNEQKELIQNNLSLKSSILNKEEERFNLILENLPFLLIAIDENDKLLYVNSKFEKFLGYSLLDLSLTGFISKIHPEDREKYKEFISDISIDKLSNVRLVEKSGKILNTSFKKNTFTLNDNLQIKLLIVDFDNSTQEINSTNIENKLIDLELKNEELKHLLDLSNSVIDNSPDIILVYDNNGKLIKYSKNSNLLNQYSFEELSTINNIPFISSTDKQEIIKNINSENFITFKKNDVVLKDKEGNDYFSILNIKKINYDNEYYIYFNFSDITSYKIEVEKNLSAAFKGVLFDYYPDITILHKIDGTILDVNHKCEERLEYTREEIINKNISEFGLILDQNLFNNTEPQLKLIHHIKSKSGNLIDVKSDSNVIEFNNKKYVLSVLKEVTTPKQRLIESRILESSLGQLLNFMNIGIIIFNQEGYLTHLSSNCETLTGIESTEWDVSSPFLVDKIAREDFIIFRQNIERVFKGEYLKDILIVFKNKDEKKKELKGSFLPVLNEDGYVSEVMLVLQEYTDFDKEKRLSNFYELILDNAPIGIITFDTNGNYTSVNEEFLKMLGYEYKREEVLTWNLYNLMDKDKILPGFVTALNGEVVDYTRDYMPTPSNQKFSFYQSFAPLRDKNGNIIGVLGLLNEITDKSIIPQNIIEAEEKFRKIFDSLEECVILFKATGKIINANKGAFLLLGDPPQYIINKDITDYFADNQSEEFEDFLFNLHSFGNANIKTKIIKSDGTTFDAEVYGKGLEISGIQHFFVVIKKIEILEKKPVEVTPTITSQKEKETNGIDSFNFLKDFDEGIIITDSAIEQTIFINDKIKELFNASIDDFHSKGILPIVTKEMDENSKYFFQKNIELCKSSQLGIKPFEIDFINREEHLKHYRVEILTFTSKILAKELKYIKFTPFKNIKFIEDEEETIKGRYYKYFEYLPIPCVIINSEGVILDLNPPFNEALQYGYSEIVNTKFEDLFFEDKERVSSFLKLHKNFHMLNEQSELRIRKRDNTFIDCRIFYTKIEDNIFLVFLHLNNIQKYLQGNIIEKDFDNRLSSIQKITGEICSGFSSFIYLIDGYTEFLSKSRELSFKEKQRLNQLLMLIEKIHLFVEKLMIFSEKKYLEQEELDIIQLLKDSIENNFGFMKNKEISLQDSKIIVRGNSWAIKSMFDDIFDFIKSSIGDGGHLSILTSTEIHPFDLNGSGYTGYDQFLIITIKEKGFRIPNDVLFRIFEPFVTSKDLNKCDVGLSFSYGVIKSLGGSISIEEDDKFDHKINIIIPFYN
ncbi:MAG TPA: PAS domain S-box protein [Bacteroidota bacterium]|nr:PAS domain S-box protein [Bacteroidota bacterium]